MSCPPAAFRKCSSPELGTAVLGSEAGFPAAPAGLHQGRAPSDLGMAMTRVCLSPRGQGWGGGGAPRQALKFTSIPCTRPGSGQTPCSACKHSREHSVALAFLCYFLFFSLCYFQHQNNHFKMCSPVVSSTFIIGEPSPQSVSRTFISPKKAHLP